MKKIVLVILSFVIIFGIKAKTIEDMFGNKVNVPDNITRILPYDPKTTFILFPIVDDIMVGKIAVPCKRYYNFISSDFLKIKNVDPKRVEDAMLLAPQVIIIGVFSEKDDVMRAKSFADKIHVPLVKINISFTALAKTYLFLGSVFDKKERGKMLALFISENQKEAKELAKSKKITETAYHAIGSSGLLTDPENSKHNEIFKFLKIPIAAKTAIPTGGHAKVSMEQVLYWNPDYIFTTDLKKQTSAYNTIKTSNQWKGISAVKSGKIYEVPSQPLGWIDNPPSINRIPGMIWLCQLFYDLPENIAREKITEFYKLFYKYDLSEDEYKELF